MDWAMKRSSGGTDSSLDAAGALVFSEIPYTYGSYYCFLVKSFLFIGSSVNEIHTCVWRVRLLQVIPICSNPEQ